MIRLKDVHSRREPHHVCVGVCGVICNEVYQKVAGRQLKMMDRTLDQLKAEIQGTMDEKMRMQKAKVYVLLLRI